MIYFPLKSTYLHYTLKLHYFLETVCGPMNDLILNIECQHNTEQIHSLIIDIPVLV